MLEKLFQYGLDIFDGHREGFHIWLRTPLAELVTPEVGFDSPVTAYTPRPVAEMGTKQGPVDLSAAAQARRERLASHRVGTTGHLPPYPTPLSLLDTITGCKRVDNAFTRIEYGVFS